MNISEKKNTGFIVLVTLLVVLVIGLTGYIAYDKISESKKNDDVVNNGKNNEDTQKIGKELFEKYGNYVYSSENLNYSNLDNETRLEMALLKSENIVYNKNFSIDSENLSSDGGIILDYYLKVNITDLEKSYKLLFGSDKNVSYSVSEYAIDDFSTSFFVDEVSNPVGCKKENNEYVCYVFWGDNTWDGDNRTMYDYSEIKNNKLNVYVNFLALNAPDYAKVCSDYDCNNIIDNNLYNIDDLKDTSKLFAKYKDKTGIYKLIFNKDSGNNWCWEETQIVKK